MFVKFSSILLAAALVLPAMARADGATTEPVGTDRYYFGLDEMRDQPEIVDIRYYYAQPSRLEFEPESARDDFVYFGAEFAGGRNARWMPASSAFQGRGGRDIMPGQPQDIELWVDWRPDITPSLYGADSRRVSRALTGAEIERIGVRADVTALLFDNSGTGTTAWHITGALGSTSLSLLTDGSAGADAQEGGLGLLWDVGVGWSSGAVSLSAGYQSASSPVDNGGGIAVLSLGADYTILPGLSVYGELNLIDDPAVDGPERMGTVIILGTGLNF